jgi:NAD-dependent deacetylase
MLEGEKMMDLIERAAADLAKSTYVIALTGAGISTESGIPDFRGPSGIWTKDPEAEKRAYQSYAKFQRNPKEYWEDRLGGPSLLGDLDKTTPNPGHYALAELERKGILKCIITQNIDNLHQKAGSKKVLDYHGNAFKLRCISCSGRFEAKEFDLQRLRIEDQLPPLCRKCGGVLKSDVVHFHEPIPTDVAQQSMVEAGNCDLMLVCGTSAVVYPFALLPRVAKQRPTGKRTVLIEINAEPTPLTEERASDYLIQGKTGQILPKIVEEFKRIFPFASSSREQQPL